MKSRNRKKGIFQKKGNIADGNIVRLIIPSMMGIVLCSVLLMGATWAWFTASVETKSTLKSANYSLEVELRDNAEGVVTKENGAYTLQAGKEYKVTLIASGDVKSGGYCIVEGDEKNLKTSHMRIGESLSFTIIPSSNGLYRFTPVWGTYSGSADITEGSIMGNGVTVSDNIENSDKLNDNTDSDANKPQIEYENGSKENVKGENTSTESLQSITEEPSTNISN